jgi:cell division topological specificity factor
MSLIERFFSRQDQKSATVARDRLKLVLATERTTNNFPFMEDLRRDMIGVMKKYLDVQDVSIKTEQDKDINLLEVEVSIGKDGDKR